jgi:hypothetical protein
MCAAAARVLDGQNLSKMGRKARSQYKAATRYRAMLAAAPSPDGNPPKHEGPGAAFRNDGSVAPWGE